MDDDELDILAWTMLGEAGGEGTQGMADVGHVVLNRLNTGRYGSSLTDVALAPKQFSTWNSGSGGNDPKGKYPKDSREFQRARQLAAQVVSGEVPGPPGRPLDYNADNITPYWADSKSRNGSYTRNGHTFYPSVPVPPGELPEVASLQDTRIPTLPPAPVTSSPDMAQMRRQAAPSQLIRDSFSQLPRPGGNLGDDLGMNPVQGGRQQAPMFDAAFDERLGAMQFTPEPINSQGMATGSSRPPAPVPASPFDRVTARLNALPPAAPVPASPFDRVTARLNALPTVPPPTGASPTTRTVQSVPVRGNVPSGGFAGQERAPSTQRPMTVEQMYAGIYPEKPGDFLLGGNTPNLPTTAPTTGISPFQVAQIGVPAIPELPGAPRTRMASAAPFPMPRPNFMPSVGTALSVRPMPPMPIPRPMMQPQQRRAPVPMPLAMRPPQQRAPLRITVQRDQPQQQQSRPTPQGFTESGNGRLVSNEYGDTYYSRHLR